ncbi:uncharacterized protein HMPREF1541_09965 [Cyphellophora europaea CBS 101466]|uniref:Large ribosomal subunit protein mL67 n=1 Tax=Cyphellophora europaea (strain CBS 101466) TaxID=1220924 RepID=W2SAZ2_CYPE1|nr:uncharacterized protein HMPREF1541_09965 [Cyphellophora europaea CBS 101466]ETN45089.1 hypothetical protein HMPREF1541_09965 [Cyphellophora europaea CBS 101466]
MASAVVAAAPHSVPPLPLSRIPRVRPPRFLPGQPRDDQLPQPEGSVPSSHVWTQGKWRNRASNAVSDRRKVVSQQVKKAIEKRYHGLNIYAYYHLLTKQVVYSLTRHMQSGQVMPQLVYHGKKTVPATLRRDVWRPYFSIHFPENDGGRQAGLKAYQRLREFSLRRQLDPQQESLMTTQEDIDKAIRKAGDPFEVRERYVDHDVKGRKVLRAPLLGFKLPKRIRARKLMNQKASSVADTSFVLGLAMEQLEKLFATRYNAQHRLASVTKGRLQGLGVRGRKRLRAIRAEEEEKELQIAQRQDLASEANISKGMVPLDRHIARRLSTEVNGAVVEDESVNRLVDAAPAEKGYDNVDCEIQVLWADMRDGTYAETWPEGVFHGELQPAATSKSAEMHVVQMGYKDADGEMVSTQRQRVNVVSGSTVHVHGLEKPRNFKTFQEILALQSEQRRENRTEELKHQAVERRRKTLVKLYSDISRAEARIATIQDLHEKDVLGISLDQSDQNLLAEREKNQALLDTLTAERERQEMQYPEESIIAEKTAKLRQMVKDVRSLDKKAVATRNESNRADTLTGSLNQDQISGRGSQEPVASAQQPTQDLDHELRHLEQANPTDYAAARDFVSNPPSEEREREVVMALVEKQLALLSKQAVNTEAVLPNEHQGLWGRVKGWIGR